MIVDLAMPKSRSQVVIMSGCQTYHVAEAFRENPSKLGLNNLDVITTSSFSNATTAQEILHFLRALVGNENKDGAILAQSYGRLLQSANPELAYNFGGVGMPMYGVHGLDDNPRKNPLADNRMSCQACSTDADCGAAGNVCVALSANERVCAADCLSNDGCLKAQTCRAFGSGAAGEYLGSACVPSTLSCAEKGTVSSM